MRIKSAIFDLDGTLIDSMFHWRKFEVDIIEDEGGFKLTPQQRDEYLLLDYRNMLIRAEKEFSVKYNYYDFCNKANSAMMQLYSDGKFDFKPYAVEFLEKLKNNGINIALATATPKEACIPFLKATNIYNYFDSILTTHDDIKVSKFKGPDIYDAALSALSGNKAEAVIFEDAMQCINTCKRNGYFTIAVEDRMQIENINAIKAIADKYITSYEEICISNGEIT